MLSDEERKDRWKKDTDDLYRSIGEFIVHFELICHAINLGIIFILSKAGLKKQSISHVILSGVTAEPLRQLFESLVSETQDLEEEDLKIVKEALNRFQKLTQDRNDIVHSTWFIGWGNGSTEDFSEANGHKFHKKGTGASLKSFKKKVEDFSNLTEEAKSLEKIFLRLHVCFVGGHSVHKNFVVLANGKISVPPET